MKTVRPRFARSSRLAASSIESLEPRIAPAVVVNPANHRVATYTDVDGDKVTITVDRGDLTNAVFTSAAGGAFGGEQLQLLQLTDSSFAGAKLSVSAAPQNGHGDGFAAVGSINAGGRDLAAITVDGDLGKLDVGDATLSTPGLKQFTALSLGAYGVSTQAVGGDLQINVLGGATSFTVKTGVTGSIVQLVGAVPSQNVVSKMTIGGSVAAGPGAGAGAILLTGSAGTIAIGGGLLGGDSDDAGKIFSSGRIASLTIRGSVTGGAGNFDKPGQEGQIHAYAGFGKIAIGGDLRGAAGGRAAYIFAGVNPDNPVFDSNANIGSVSVRGSVIGGSATSGVIAALGSVGKLSIGGDVDATATGANSVLLSLGKMGSLTVGGSLKAGTNGTLLVVAATFGPVTIAGDVHADASGSLNIGALGNDVSGPALTDAQAKKLSLAIQSVKVGGSVVNANIFAGQSLSSSAVNPDVAVGPVKVGGDWLGSTLAVGVSSGADNQFGTADDALGGPGGTGGRSAIIAAIASLTVGGQMAGTATTSGDHFGIVAQQIGSVTVGGTKVPLRPGPSNDAGMNAIEWGITGDFTIREV